MSAVISPPVAAPVVPAVVPALHVPEEPTEARVRWFEQVAEGGDWDKIIDSDDGPGAWLWERWRVLDAAGMDRTEFLGVVAGYRREVWYWLLGDRTWAQCVSGLIGRVGRRLPAAASGS